MDSEADKSSIFDKQQHFSARNLEIGTKKNTQIFRNKYETTCDQSLPTRNVIGFTKRNTVSFFSFEDEFYLVKNKY